MARKLTLLGASLSMTLSLLVFGGGQAAAAGSYYCYGDDTMCWEVNSTQSEAVFQGEFEIRTGPVPGLYFDTARVLIRWRILPGEVTVQNAFIELSLNETTDRKAYFFQQVREANNNAPVSMDSDTSEWSDDGHYQTSTVMRSDYGAIFSEYAEMQISLNLATPSTNSWMAQVRSPLMEDVPGPMKFVRADLLPDEPIWFGWVF